MDTLTQGLLGAVASQSALQKALGRQAGWVGFVSGLVADADVVIPLFVDLDLPFAYHRHFSHALAFIPVGALLGVLPFLLSRANRSRFLLLYFASFLGFATHGILDAATAFGTHLFWPFTERREAWDCLPIVDPIFSLVLALGWWRGARTKRRKPALFALLFAVAYALFGLYQHERAEDAQSAIAEARGHRIEDRRLLPVPGSLVLWRGLYLSEGRIHGDNLRVPWIGETGHQSFGNQVAFRPEEGLSTSSPSEAERDLLDRFQVFVDGWSARQPGRPDRLGDLRLSHRFDFQSFWGLSISRDSEPPVVWEEGFTRVERDDIRAVMSRIFIGDEYEAIP